MDAIAESIKTVEDKRGSPAQWAERHLEAWRNPQGFELPIWHLIRGLAQYGARTREEYGSKVGNDGFLGPAWKDIADSIRTLLNGNLGRFDGGTLDALLHAICAENGVELE